MKILLAIHGLRKQPRRAAAIALGVFVGTVLLRQALFPAMGQIGLYLTFTPFVLLAAVMGSWRWGVLATLLAGLAGIELSAINGVDDDYGRRLALFAMTCGLIIGIVHVMTVLEEKLVAERDRSHLLFKELQHRVSNNMQLVGSILRLHQRSAAHNPEAVRMLREAESRLNLMARLHRKLYDPEMANVPIQAYLSELCSDILDLSHAQHVECRVRVEVETLPATRVMPLSLIVAEVMTNSIKHAFRDRDDGVIELTLQRRSEDDLALIIRDNGPGLPETVSSDGLGMRILHGLVAQVQGRLLIQNDSGVTTHIAFPG